MANLYCNTTVHYNTLNVWCSKAVRLNVKCTVTSYCPTASFMYDTMTVAQCRLFSAELLSIYTHLFSRRNVWIIEFTVVLPTFGCTLRPASAIVRPWLTTWSTIVALISSGIRLCTWPLLPLPLFCPLPLPPRTLTPLPRGWPSISVSQYCRNGTHYVLLGSYMLVKWGFMGFSSDSDCRKVAYHWLQLMLHTPLLISESWDSPERNCSI